MRQRLNTAGNALLRRLPRAEIALIEANLEAVIMTLGDVVCPADAAIEYAVFPTSGVVSLLAPDQEGDFLEIGLVGRDGMFGIPLAIGLANSPVRAMVQGDGAALRMTAARFRRVLGQCPVLAMRLHAYTYRLMEQVTRTAVCNSFHPLEARAARWMLAMSDRMESDVFMLTQVLLADMLGVLRPSVSQAARRLGKGGLVTYRRGEVTILDRPGLVAAACSCYEPPSPFTAPAATRRP